MLILIAGLPGSGKTTLARVFSAHLNAIHLNSDLLRKELGLMGNYSPEDKRTVYSTLLNRAQTALLNGKTVVVDSTFYKQSIREPFQELAKACGVSLRWVEVRSQETTIRERLTKPRPDSEADFAVYEKIRDESEPILEPHLVLWSDEMPLEEMAAALAAYTISPKP